MGGTSAPPTSNASAAVGPPRIGGRYRVDALLGEGGMAVIYRVQDSADGSIKALKQLRRHANPLSQPRNVELFQREFHTLAQLRHPRAVAVYDYGVDGEDPYYTMELLDGGDLVELAPVQWRRACALARDVCSALSLLHSRRLVYRDLSPRNVRCTSDGQAKLIDFGAVIPMGLSRQIVGTPAFCAPEVLDFQQLDARTDLYALGATLYYTLTGHRAYPARTFQDLREAWLGEAPRPSHYVREIPPALDQLLMDLLRLDPNSRPASAAEVMERLSGIAELAVDEQLPVAQAYLTTPGIVGRATQLEQVQQRVVGALRGRGGSLLVTGSPGLGRSRFLDAAILHAKFEGMLVVRADADDAQGGDYGVVRALCARLLQLLPDIALALLRPRLPVLGHVMPELLEHSPGTQLAVFDGVQLRPRAQTALREWFEAVARERPLLVAIDDLQRLDGPSAAFVALLGCEIARQPLVLVATTNLESDANQAAVGLLANAAQTLPLANLVAEETRELLESVFGDVPHLDLVAQRLHEVSSGNPRDVMRLAQHLVDKRAVVYQAGAWALPRRIDPADVPDSLAETLRQAVAMLSPDARRLGHALALAPDHAFSLSECARLSAEEDPVRLLARLDELIAAGPLRQRRERYGLSRQGWIPVLCNQAEQEEPLLHARLADLFEARGGLEILAALHMFKAGQADRAIDRLVSHAESSQLATDPSSDAFVQLVASLPADWLTYYDLALDLCERQRRPKMQAFQLRSRMAGFLGLTGFANTHQLEKLVDQLYQASGLDIYASLDPALDPGERLKQTFEQNQARYQNSPPEQRTLDPFSAIRQLARALIQSCAVIVVTRNLVFWRALPSLRPYLVLSPALTVVQQIIDGVGHRYAGRTDQAVAIYRVCLERLAHPDRAGLDESHHHHAGFGVRLGLGLLESSVGSPNALAIANELQTNPLYEVSAWTVRMAYHLARAETRDAEQCRRRAELLRVQNHAQQFLDGGHHPIELCAHVVAGNLIGVKQCLTTIEPWADNFPGWQPLLRYARGEYHRLRGDYTSALLELQASAGIEEHQLWAHAAGAEISTLCELGDYERAANTGIAHLDTAQRRELGSNCYLIEIPLAWTELARRKLDRARQYADSALATLQKLGATGLWLAQAHAVCARIAVASAQPEAAAHHSAQALAQFGPTASRKIVARYNALVREERSAARAMPSSRVGLALSSTTAASESIALSKMEPISTITVTADADDE